MAFVPHIRLYRSDGNTLQYTFLVVQSTNMPQSVKKNTVIEAKRGNGAIVIPGSDASWEIVIHSILAGADYEAIDTKIAALETVIVLHTPYVIKFDKTATTTYSYNVKRILPIEYPDSLRNYDQVAIIKLLANSW
jgi:hypothetical protein